MLKARKPGARTGVAQPTRPKAAYFRPHAFENRVTVIGGGEPLIMVTPEVQEEMYHITDQARAEAGWLGTVSELALRTYLIDRIFIFKQRVDGVTNTLTKEGLSATGIEILKEPGGMETWNRIKFWGHNHGTLSTTPSIQDNEQLFTFRKSGHSYFIRGIINREGRMEFSIIYYDQGILIEDVPWQVFNPIGTSRAPAIAKELAEKVTWIKGRRAFGNSVDMAAYFAAAAMAPGEHYE
ncbi:MAG: hypothetical protein WCT16_03580 [Candidatus Buchananbacteria bacterium]